MQGGENWYEMCKQKSIVIHPEYVLSDREGRTHSCLTLSEKISLSGRAGIFILCVCTCLLGCMDLLG